MFPKSDISGPLERFPPHPSIVARLPEIGEFEFLPQQGHAAVEVLDERDTQVSIIPQLVAGEGREFQSSLTARARPEPQRQQRSLDNPSRKPSTWIERVTFAQASVTLRVGYTTALQYLMGVLPVAADGSFVS